MGTPSLTATNEAKVKIIVLKNGFTPEFTNLPFTVTLSPTVPVGTSVYDVNAKDLDTEVSIPAIDFNQYK